MKSPLALVGLVACIGLTALSGCATTTAAAPEPTATATNDNPYGGFPVDPPAPDEVVLTVTGTTTVDYTYSQLQAMATEEVAIREPFVDKDQTFTGIPLADLFASAGIDPTAQVDTVALNDYHFPDSAANFESANGVLAVLRSGEPIPMDQGGPIRIIFPKDSSYYSYLDSWNWSIRSLVKVG